MGNETAEWRRGSQMWITRIPMKERIFPSDLLPDSLSPDFDQLLASPPHKMMSPDLSSTRVQLNSMTAFHHVPSFGPCLFVCRRLVGCSFCRVPHRMASPRLSTPSVLVSGLFFQLSSLCSVFSPPFRTMFAVLLIAELSGMRWLLRRGEPFCFLLLDVADCLT